MTLRIDWDNYEVIESDDYNQSDLDQAIDSVVEYLEEVVPYENIKAYDLLDTLVDMRDGG